MQLNLFITFLFFLFTSAGLISQDNLSVRFEVRNTNCNINSGSIIPHVLNGDPPFSFKWSSGSIDSVLFNLEQGPYSVTISDSNDSIAKNIIIGFENNPLLTKILSIDSVGDIKDVRGSDMYFDTETESFMILGAVIPDAPVNPQGFGQEYIYALSANIDGIINWTNLIAPEERQFASIIKEFDDKIFLIGEVDSSQETIWILNKEGNIEETKTYDPYLKGRFLGKETIVYDDKLYITGGGFTNEMLRSIDKNGTVCNETLYDPDNIYAQHLSALCIIGNEDVGFYGIGSYTETGGPPWSQLLIEYGKDMSLDSIHELDGELSNYRSYNGGVSSSGEICLSHKGKVTLLNSSLEIIWQKQIGPTSTSQFGETIFIDDADRIYITSTISSMNNNVTEYFGGKDVWIYCLDLEGNLLWEITLGGEGDDSSHKLIQGNDGNIYSLVSSNSQNFPFNSEESYSTYLFQISNNSSSKIDLGSDLVACIDDTIQLFNLLNVDSELQHFWSNDMNSDTITLLLEDSTTIGLTVIDEYGCSYSDSINIEIINLVFNISDTLCIGEEIEINNVIYDFENPSGIEIIDAGNSCDSMINVDLFFSNPMLSFFDINEEEAYVFSVDFEIAGGIEPYSAFVDGVQLNSIDSSQIFEEEGSFELIVIDNIGCSFAYVFELESYLALQDNDGDGFILAEDCDDENSNVNPGQIEEPYNGIDDDCNSQTLDDDLDQDGFSIDIDCDDENENINPNAEEIPNNEIDEDCDGEDLISSLNISSHLSIKVFPNPTKEIVNIEISEDIEYRIRLFNTKGELVLTTLNAKKLEVDSLLDGFYIMEIQNLNNGLRIVEKLIIIK